MTEPRPPSKRGERLIGDIVREVETVGPNVAEVARRLKLPEERVRRCYRSRVLKNGFHLIARSDWGALGLRPVRVVADISKTYAKYASDIFYAMDNRWFFLEFDRLFPDGKFNIAFLLPEEHYGEFPRILAEMEGMGFLETVHETYHPRWRIVTPMRGALRLQEDHLESGLVEPPLCGATVPIAHAEAGAGLRRRLDDHLEGAQRDFAHQRVRQTELDERKDGVQPPRSRPR